MPPSTQAAKRATEAAVVSPLITAIVLSSCLHFTGNLTATPNCGRGGNTHGGLFQGVLEVILGLLTFSTILDTTNSPHHTSFCFPYKLWLIVQRNIQYRMTVNRFFHVYIHAVLSHTKSISKPPSFPLSYLMNTGSPQKCLLRPLSSALPPIGECSVLCSGRLHMPDTSAVLQPAEAPPFS